MNLHGPVATIAWQSLRTAPLVAALVLMLAIGSAVFYLPQSAQLRRRWRWLLIGLRMMSVLILAISFLQPSLTRRPTSRESGAIVVIVDRSPSMGVHDPQRRPAQWVALADGLGMLPEGSRLHGDEINRNVADAQTRLTEISDAQSELAYALLSGRSTTESTSRLAMAVSEFNGSAALVLSRRAPLNSKSQLAIALDNLKEHIERPRTAGREDTWITRARASLTAVGAAAEVFQSIADEKLYNANPAVRSVCRELQNLSRLGTVEQALVRPGSGLLYKMPKSASVFGFAVGSEITALPLSGGGKPVRRLLLDPQPGGLDLSTALRAAVDELGETPVDAVVLFSDGRRMSGKSMAEGSMPSSITNVPVFAVAAAPKVSSVDWSLSHISIPAGVHAGEPFAVRARVHGVGLKAGASTEVRCEVGSTATVSSKRVALGVDQSVDVEFTMKMDEPGSWKITLGLPTLAGEITSENNRAERWIKVYPQKLKVALLTTSPGWDYRYLRDSLARQVGISLYAKVTEEEPLSLSPDDILKQDAIVMFDIAASSLTTAQWDAVKTVAVQGGGLVVLVAGPEHFPMEYGTEPLSDLLPYWSNSRESVPTSGAVSNPHAETRPAWKTWQGENPIYRFSHSDVDQNRSGSAPRPSADELVWASLPPLYRYLSLPPLKPVSRTLLFERESGEPVVTEMQLGAGHVLFVGLDETWRWRNKTGVAFQEALWIQLLLNGVEDPYAVVTDHLSMDIGTAAAGPGRAVEVRLKAKRPSSPNRSPTTAEIRVLRDGALVRTQTISPTPANPAVCSGTLLGLPVGDYIIEGQAEGQIIQYPLHVVGQFEMELEDPSGDRSALDRIAKTSGGKVFSLEQLPQLPPLLASLARQPRLVTVSLWDSVYLFVFVAGCFTAEWALRKRLGLA